jgi:hypothetical protein
MEQQTGASKIEELNLKTKQRGRLPPKFRRRPSSGIPTAQPLWRVGVS